MKYSISASYSTAFADNFTPKVSHNSNSNPSPYSYDEVFMLQPKKKNVMREKEKPAKRPLKA